MRVASKLAEVCMLHTRLKSIDCVHFPIARGDAAYHLLRGLPNSDVVEYITPTGALRGDTDCIICGSTLGRLTL